MKTRRMLVLCVGTAVAPALLAQPQAATPSTVPAAAEVVAADALLKRYQAAGDPREAQKILDEIRSWAARSPSAAFVCGVLAAQAGSVAADRTAAVQCLETAAQHGHPQAQHCLALLLLEAGNDPVKRAEARRLLASSAFA